VYPPKVISDHISQEKRALLFGEEEEEEARREGSKGTSQAREGSTQA